MARVVITDIEWPAIAPLLPTTVPNAKRGGRIAVS